MMEQSRAKNSATTRNLILAAARRRFASETYEGVGLRDVAQDAGVNVALVSRYFGSKEDLFRKVLLERDDDWFGSDHTPEGVARWMGGLTSSDDPTERGDIDRLLIILRSASSPATARLVSESFDADVFQPLTALIGEPHAAVRARLALSLVIGATVLKGILSVEPLSEAEREEGHERMVELIRRSLDE